LTANVDLNSELVCPIKGDGAMSPSDNEVPVGQIFQNCDEDGISSHPRLIA
jgi:hypothetical protein